MVYKEEMLLLPITAILDWLNSWMVVDGLSNDLNVCLGIVVKSIHQFSLFFFAVTTILKQI